jgi:hypothetical protein
MLVASWAAIGLPTHLDIADLADELKIAAERPAEP